MMAFPSGWQTANQHAAVIAVQQQQKAMMQLTAVDTKGASPEAYVQQLAAAGKVTTVNGSSERVGGFNAWAGRLGVQNQDGSQGSLIAMFIEQSPNQTFQILGQTAAPGDAGESAILGSARSFRPLTDPARLNPKPDRLELVRAPISGTLSQVLSRVGPVAVTPDQETVINNLNLDAAVARGQIIKVIRPGQRK